MLSALLAVLVLAGAPTTTRVECNPALPVTVELGLTVSDEAQVIGGKVVQGPLDHVILAPMVCGGLLYASVSPSLRLQIRRMNPTINFDQWLATGLQVALHEANHVALNSTDECQVEKVTRSQVNSLIEKMGDRGRISAEEAIAAASDAGLPAAYHGC